MHYTSLQDYVTVICGKMVKGGRYRAVRMHWREDLGRYVAAIQWSSTSKKRAEKDADAMAAQMGLERR